jgi:hypothetical protein
LRRCTIGEHPAHHQRQQAEEHEGADQAGRQDGGQRVDPGDFGAGVHKDQGGRQHAQLADPGEGPDLHVRQSGQQVQDEERHGWNQPQREQVESAVARDALVQRRQLVAETGLDQVAQQVAGRHHRKCRAQGGGHGHQQGAPHQAEQGAAGQREDGGARQRQRRHPHVHRHKEQGGLHRMRGPRSDESPQAVLDELQAEETSQIEPEEQAHARQHDQHQGQLAEIDRRGKELGT